MPTALFTDKFTNKRFLLTFNLTTFRSYFIIRTRNAYFSISISEYIIYSSDYLSIWDIKKLRMPETAEVSVGHSLMI